MPIVQTPEIIDPLAMSPEHAAAFLSLSRRALSNLIADGAILAKKHGVRTLVDVASIRVYYASLPKTVSGSIPNAPQCARPAPRRRNRAVRS
jgi:hypothetical protein